VDFVALIDFLNLLIHSKIGSKFHTLGQPNQAVKKVNTFSSFNNSLALYQLTGQLHSNSIKLKKLEFEATKMLINKYFPRKGLVCDIGSGPGRYAIELIKSGYKVTLIDVSKKSLELAKNMISKSGLKAEEYLCLDAINLASLNSNHYDAVLLLGPLYHITKKADRIKVLEDTKEKWNSHSSLFKQLGSFESRSFRVSRKAG
jgi:2-polyprenyl-3-methyl-5-hydroxy-6-metoxy-1,4-benzoquinol methylase